MATINFFIQSKKSPAGIYVRLKEGRDVDAKAKTKYAIDPKDWSDAKGRPLNLKDADLKSLNEDLISLGKDLLANYNRSVGNQTINTQWLKDFINPQAENGSIPTRLVEYIDY